MKQDELKPFEEVLDQVSCNCTKYKPNVKGVMVITTSRVLWKPSGFNEYPCQILRWYINKNGERNDIKVGAKQRTGEQNYWAM